MKKFDEIAFVCALTEREADAQEMKKLFNPEWLTEKSYIPIVKAVFDYIDKYKCSPSFGSLHEYMEEMDKEKYDARYREKLTMLASVQSDKSKQVMAITKAKESAAAMSLTAMISMPTFQELLSDGEGDKLRTEIARWLTLHSERVGEEVIDIKSGLERLISDVGFSGRPKKISTGISCIDFWTHGGTRPGQLGILMAPTGNGKSAVLMNIALHIATAEERPVLFLTNELTIQEQLERFLVRMQAPDQGPGGNDIYYPLQTVQDDPTIAYRGLKRRWQFGLETRLFVGSTDLNATCDQIEERLNLMRVQYGFKPAALVIDFMERMAPSDKGVRRGEKEYIYFGEIAKELVRLGKRTNTTIWTAIQTNRGGMNKGVEQSMEFAQGSTRHLQEAACVIALRKEVINMDAEGNEKIEVLAFKELKQRHSAMNDRGVRLRVHLDRMYITGEEVEVPNDADIEVPKDQDVYKKGKKMKSQQEARGK